MSVLASLGYFIIGALMAVVAVSVLIASGRASGK
jgi:hypothetical protein